MRYLAGRLVRVNNNWLADGKLPWWDAHLPVVDESPPA